jgi:hypothetical protein
MDIKPSDDQLRSMVAEALFEKLDKDAVQKIWRHLRLGVFGKERVGR